MAVWSEGEGKNNFFKPTANQQVVIPTVSPVQPYHTTLITLTVNDVNSVKTLLVSLSCILPLSFLSIWDITKQWDAQGGWKQDGVFDGVCSELLLRLPLKETKSLLILKGADCKIDWLLAIHTDLPSSNAEANSVMTTNTHQQHWNVYTYIYWYTSGNQLNTLLHRFLSKRVGECMLSVRCH